MENDYILIKICETHPGGILRLGYSYDLAYFHPDILIEAIRIKKSVYNSSNFPDFDFFIHVINMTKKQK